MTLDNLCMSEQYLQYLWAKMKPEEQTTEQLKPYQPVQSADPSKQKPFQLYNRTEVHFSDTV